MTGFGYDAYYHADNECCSLDWMKQGMMIFSKILDNYVTPVETQRKNVAAKKIIEKKSKQ